MQSAAEIAAPPPSPGRKNHPAAFIRGLPISCVSRDYILSEIGRTIEARETGHFVVVTNPEIMYHGVKVPGMGDYIRNSDFSVCDGVGVILAGLAWGHRVPRFTGPNLQLACSEFGVSRGWRHFYYGGKPGVADEMARRLKEKYPGLEVCGTYSPPFGEISPEEDARIVDMINAAEPDIVWVGLSVPGKERWVASHLGRLERTVDHRRRRGLRLSFGCGSLGAGAGPRPGHGMAVPPDRRTPGSRQADLVASGLCGRDLSQGPGHGPLSQSQPDGCAAAIARPFFRPIHFFMRTNQ